MINFKMIENFKPGLIQSILKNSYAEFIDCFPNEKARIYSPRTKRIKRFSIVLSLEIM
jgi:hypothetical protein